MKHQQNSFLSPKPEPLRKFKTGEMRTWWRKLIKNKYKKACDGDAEEELWLSRIYRYRKEFELARIWGNKALQHAIEKECGFLCFQADLSLEFIRIAEEKFADSKTL